MESEDPKMPTALPGHQIRKTALRPGISEVLAGDPEMWLEIFKRREERSESFFQVLTTHDFALSIECFGVFPSS